MKKISTILSLLALTGFAIAADEAKPVETKPAPVAKAQTSEDFFKSFDSNSDGSVTLEELKASPSGKGDPTLEEWLKRKDKDGDGKLSLAEFVTPLPKGGKK